MSDMIEFLRSSANKHWHRALRLHVASRAVIESGDGDRLIQAKFACTAELNDRTINAGQIALNTFNFLDRFEVSEENVGQQMA